MQEFESTVTAAGHVLLASLVFGIAVRTALFWRGRSRPRHPRRGLALLRAAGSAGLAAAALGLLGFVFSLQRGGLFLSMGLKAAIATLLLAWVAVEIAARARPASVAPTAWTWLRSSIASVAWVLVATGLWMLNLQARSFPAAAAETVLAPPFAGAWVVTGGGPTARTNHHHRIESQRHALDIARLCEDGRLFRGDGGAAEDSCTWDAEVRSPVDGTVVAVVDSLPDLGSREQLAGNHLIVRIDERRYVALAHLRQASVSVTVGERVRAGQSIARAGSSGNTDFPHLHVHVQDGPAYDLRASRSIPFRLGPIERRRTLWWRQFDSVDVLMNDQLRPTVAEVAGG